MEVLTQLFGYTKHVNVLQMSLRGCLVFIIGLILIRISGRRTFGMRMPLDNIITVLIGAILSKAVTGEVPFVPTIVACTAIVIIHRVFAWAGIHNKLFDRLIKGKSRILYENGVINKKNVEGSLIDENDILEGVRVNSNLGSIEETESIYMERNGEISVVKKGKQHV